MRPKAARLQQAWCSFPAHSRRTSRQSADLAAARHRLGHGASLVCNVHDPFFEACDTRAAIATGPSYTIDTVRQIKAPAAMKRPDFLADWRRTMLRILPEWHRATELLREGALRGRSAGPATAGRLELRCRLEFQGCSKEHVVTAPLLDVSATGHPPACSAMGNPSVISSRPRSRTVHSRSAASYFI
jgi:nicotinic acid mononucleotide adenylyltransferase